MYPNLDKVFFKYSDSTHRLHTSKLPVFCPYIQLQSFYFDKCNLSSQYKHECIDIYEKKVHTFTWFVSSFACVMLSLYMGTDLHGDLEGCVQSYKRLKTHSDLGLLVY